jgi:hypothetical protein
LGNPIGDDGIVLIADSLQFSRTLRTLDLWCGKVGTLGGQALAAGIASPSTPLRALLLGKNALGDQGASALISAFYNNSHLQILDLTGNDLTDRFAALLHPVLSNYARLKVLVVKQNRLTIRGCRLLLDAALHSPTMRVLNVADNILTVEDCAALIQRYESATSVTSAHRQHHDRRKMVSRHPGLALLSASEADEPAAIDGVTPEELSTFSNSMHSAYEYGAKKEFRDMQVLEFYCGSSSFVTDAQAMSNEAAPTWTPAAKKEPVSSDKAHSRKAKSVDSATSHKQEEDSAEMYQDDGTPVSETFIKEWNDEVLLQGMRDDMTDAQVSQVAEASEHDREESSGTTRSRPADADLNHDESEQLPADTDDQPLTDLPTEMEMVVRELEQLELSDADAYEGSIVKLARSLSAEPVEEQQAAGGVPEDTPHGRNNERSGADYRSAATASPVPDRYAASDAPSSPQAAQQRRPSNSQNAGSPEEDFVEPAPMVSASEHPTENAAPRTPRQQQRQMSVEEQRAQKAHEDAFSGPPSPVLRSRVNSFTEFDELQDLDMDGRQTSQSFEVNQNSGSLATDDLLIDEDDVVLQAMKEREERDAKEKSASEPAKAAPGAEGRKASNSSDRKAPSERKASNSTDAGAKSPSTEAPVMFVEPDAPERNGKPASPSPGLSRSDSRGSAASEDQRPVEERIERALERNQAFFAPLRIISDDKTNSPGGSDKCQIEITKEFIAIHRVGVFGNRKRTVRSYAMLGGLEVEQHPLRLGEVTIRTTGEKLPPTVLQVAAASIKGADIVKMFAAFKRAAGFVTDVGDDADAGMSLAPRAESTSVDGDEKPVFLVANYDENASSSSPASPPASKSSKDNREAPQARERAGSTASVRSNRSITSVRSNAQRNSQRPSTPTVVAKRRLKIIADYDPDDDRMLKVRDNEIVEFVREEQGWFVCRNQSGEVGYVSPYYTEEYQS